MSLKYIYKHILIYLVGPEVINQAKMLLALSGNFSTAAPGKVTIYSEKMTPGSDLSEVSQSDGLKVLS